MRLSIFFFAVLFALALPSLSAASVPAIPANHIPPIARIAGFTVGVDTIQGMERRFGPAFTFIGVHPNSGHSWWVANANIHIVATYSESGDRGAFIDSLEIDSAFPPLNQGLGLTHERRRSRAFIGAILPGMREATVLRLLKHRLPSPKVLPHELTWQMPGSAVIHRARDGYPARYFTTWDATIHFDYNRVDWIEVSCE